MTKPQAPDPETPQILVCEDDPVQGKLLEQLLKARGYACVGPFSNCEEAAEAARTEPIRAALLDVSLEDGPSKEAARVLKKRGIPFAFITGYGPGTSATIGAFSSELIVPKPVCPEVLVDIMDTLIPKAFAE
jgi:DNA-binding response OmpR family regulator